jgi:ketosteroid isomerase-like protein
MSDQNLDLVRGGYDAFLRGDLPGVLSILADDVVWNVPPPLPQAGQAHGREEVGAFFERLLGIWEDFNVEVEDFVSSGDRVCVIGRGSGKVDGRDASYGFVHCWTVAGDRVARFDEYAAPGPELL